MSVDTKIYFTNRVTPIEIAAAIENELQQYTVADANLARKVEILKSVSGVGNILAHTIITYLPEIGTLSREAVSSLAVLAPMNQDSGKFRGKCVYRKEEVFFVIVYICLYLVRFKVMFKLKKCIIV